MLPLIKIQSTIGGKILYLLEDTQIDAYFYNDNTLEDDEIEKRYEDDEYNINTDFIHVGHIIIDDEWLHNIAVKEAYRKNKIGSILIELAVEYLNLNKIACVNGDRYQYSLTADGENLIVYCITQQIISEQMCIIRGVPLVNESDSDPGLISIKITSILSESGDQEQDIIDEEEEKINRSALLNSSSSFRASSDVNQKKRKRQLTLDDWIREDPHSSSSSLNEHDNSSASSCSSSSSSTTATLSGNLHSTFQPANPNSSAPTPSVHNPFDRFRMKRSS